MVGWHHRFKGHEFEQPLGVGDGQGSLLQSMGLQRVSSSHLVANVLEFQLIQYFELMLLLNIC